MEEENNPKGFRIDFDDIPTENGPSGVKESPAAVPAEPPFRPWLSKPARLAVFGSCALLMLLLLGYFQLSARINRINSAGSHQIKDLSVTLKDRLDNLSKAIADQKAATEAGLQDLKKQIRSNAADIRSLRKKLADTEKAVKQVAEIEKKVPALTQTMVVQSDQIHKLNDRLQQVETKESTIGALKTGMKDLTDKLKAARAQIDTLISSQIDQQKIDKAVKGLRDDMKGLINQSDTETQKSLMRLQERINTMEKAIRAEVSRHESKPATPPPAHNASPGGSKIIEQEIK